MGVPIVYRKSGETGLASYDALDAALGVGYKRYYGLTTLSGGSTFILSPSVSDSMTQSTESTTCTTSETTLLDKDFDMTFNFPQIIQGEIVVNLSHGSKTFSGAASGGTYAYFRIQVTAYKVSSAGTETSIGSALGNYRRIEWNTAQSWRENFSITAAQTSFAIGEKLRINVIIKGLEAFDNTGNVTEALYHDPTNREDTPSGDTDFTSHDTTLIVDVPYKVDL